MEEKTTMVHGGNWYVVHCKPLKESAAAANLERYLDLETYLPLALRQGHGRVDQVPLFPGYVFVRADLGTVSISGINSTPGVLKLLAFGGGPQLVPADVIDSLRRQLDQLNARGGLPTHSFRPGDVVQIKSGALRGLSAVFTGPTTPGARVHILLEFMGRRHEVRIAVEDLERGRDPQPVCKLGRRTRGKGRRIRDPIEPEERAA